MVLVRRCVLLVVMLVGLCCSNVQAQCAMCSLNAENNTKDSTTQAEGLNNGILFLLAMPFLIGGGVGYLWYTRYRVTNTK